MKDTLESKIKGRKIKSCYRGTKEKEGQRYGYFIFYFTNNTKLIIDSFMITNTNSGIISKFTKNNEKSKKE